MLNTVSFTRQKPVKLVLDLDDTLISFICEVGKKDTDIENILQNRGQNIGEESIVESGGIIYYLYNGWKEIIKYAMELSENNLIFFSAGSRERNEDIIPKILERVLERDPTEYVRNNVKIFSWDHLLDFSRLSNFKDNHEKKDLNVVVSSAELKYTMLIDDSVTFMMPDQRKNFLKIFGPASTYGFSKCRKISQQELASLPKDSRQYNSFFAMNRLLYVAGVLRDVCDKYSREDRDLVDIMWDDHGFEDKSQVYELPKRYEYYQSGLEVLKEINNDVSFLINNENDDMY